METLEAIFTRRSIRKFSDRQIQESDINRLLKAGMYAPSANNSQPWHFVVINERELLDRIPTFHPWSKMCFQAPLAIVVCAYVPAGKKFDLWVQDCSAATQNILLAAHAIGLGGVWLGVHPREERIAGVRDLLGLPEEVHPVSIVVLGYPNEQPETPERFDLAKVHFNQW